MLDFTGLGASTATIAADLKAIGLKTGREHDQGDEEKTPPALFPDAEVPTGSPTRRAREARRRFLSETFGAGEDLPTAAKLRGMIQEATGRSVSLPTLRKDLLALGMSLDGRKPVE